MKLPVDALIPEIQERLKTGRRLILQASPGAGKTTRVPPALLNITRRQIVVLEPRRLAARLSAERVAQEMGEPCGRTTGYQIRYERMFGPQTRLKFITEGLFLRLLLSDPMLNDVECVVLDEFHERHIHTDVTLALVRHLQNTLRPDLKLVIMSATLDAESLQTYMPDAAVIQSELRMHAVDIEFQPHPNARPVDHGAAGAVSHLLRERKVHGHILVFLPGAAEIRRTAERLEDLARTHDCDLLELRSETPIDQQRRVFEESGRRKIILATNVAETSITIDGVVAVVDCGLAKIPAHDPWSGLPLLQTKPISQASCIQRAGRAGRTAPGMALRLYTKHEYLTRPAAEIPEIQRLDLTQILLELQAVAERFPAAARFEASTLPWFEAPPGGMVQGCRELLRILGATDALGQLSDAGRTMAG
ncbi:MAG TPA: helicase-related protein, partial [Acidobacteriota bacterium]|nr:helicase-related protein [Acidobacteriota bacterium]